MSTTKKFDPYMFSVHTECVFIEGDRYFKASVFELPDVEVYEKTAAEAYGVIIQCIVDLHDAAIHDDRPFPRPEKRDDDEYSGRVTLRMPKELHKRLVLQAKRNGTTLTTEIVCQLSGTSSIQEVAHQLSIEMFKSADHLDMLLQSGSTATALDRVIKRPYSAKGSELKDYCGVGTSASVYPAQSQERSRGH